MGLATSSEPGLRSFTLFALWTEPFGSGQGKWVGSWARGRGGWGGRQWTILPELNPKGSSVDDVGVSQLPFEAWIAVGLIIGATVLCLLHSLATHCRIEFQIHNTKIKARSLRDAYAAQLAKLEAEQAMNEQIAIVGQGPRDQAAPMAQAA